MRISRTAAYVAFYRALEGDESGRAPLFHDALAPAFLSPQLAGAVRLARHRPLRRLLLRYADWRAPGARSSAIARTCFVDDVVRRAVARECRQLVLLGAGFDCRAHRMPELREVAVFEVDRAEMQAHKRRCLEAGRHAGLRADVRYVAVDFTRDSLEARLADGGWDRDRPSIFVWEGVTNYLSEDAVAGVLRLVGAAAAGTTLVFTYVHRGVLDGSLRFFGADRVLRNVERLGEPWTFGMGPEEVPALLERFGLSLEEDLGADEYRRRHLGSGGEELRGYGFYRVAVATKASRRGAGSPP